MLITRGGGGVGRFDVKRKKSSGRGEPESTIQEDPPNLRCGGWVRQSFVCKIGQIRVEKRLAMSSRNEGGERSV